MRDVFEALPIAVELRELRLMVEPFLWVEDVVRGLPWRAADSCRTLGIFAVEEAWETLACRCWLDGTRDCDAVWSSGRAAPVGLEGWEDTGRTLLASCSLCFCVGAGASALGRRFDFGRCVGLKEALGDRGRDDRREDDDRDQQGELGLVDDARVQP